MCSSYTESEPSGDRKQQCQWMGLKNTGSKAGTEMDLDLHRGVVNGPLRLGRRERSVRDHGYHQEDGED